MSRGGNLTAVAGQGYRKGVDSKQQRKNALGGTCPSIEEREGN